MYCNELQIPFQCSDDNFRIHVLDVSTFSYSFNFCENLPCTILVFQNISQNQFGFIHKATDFYTIRMGYNRIHLWWLLIEQKVSGLHRSIKSIPKKISFTIIHTWKAIGPFVADEEYPCYKLGLFFSCNQEGGITTIKTYL